MFLFILSLSVYSQEKEQDVFIPISKYIESGDAESLSAWFASNLDMNVLGCDKSCSRKQAQQILKSFFLNYTPKAFEVVHKSGTYPLKYAIGVLNGGGEKFKIVIFVKTSEDGNFIQQFKIEKE